MEGVAWDNATTGGDNPPASDSISGGGEVGGFANHQNQNRSEWALVTKKQLRFSQPVLAGSEVAPSPRCGRGLPRSHTSVSSIWQ